MIRPLGEKYCNGCDQFVVMHEYVNCVMFEKKSEYKQTSAHCCKWGWTTIFFQQDFKCKRCEDCIEHDFPELCDEFKLMRQDRDEYQSRDVNFRMQITSLNQIINHKNQERDELLKACGTCEQVKKVIKMNIETLIENQRLKKELAHANMMTSCEALAKERMERFYKDAKEKLTGEIAVNFFLSTKINRIEEDRRRDVKQTAKWQSWTRQVYGAYCRQRDKHRTARNTASMLYIGCLLLAAWIGFREDK